MSEDLQDKKTGLALGGGAVLGAAHIGILKALGEYEISVDHIAGTSIGAFIASLYAFGVGPDEIERIASGLDWLEISKISLRGPGLLSNEAFGAIIRERIGEVDMEDARIPISIITADIANGEKVVISRGKVAQAVMASTAIPGIYEPVEIENRFLVDGGMIENVPVQAVRELGADFIMGVDLNASHAFRRPENILEVLLNSLHLAIISASRLREEEADFMIIPDLSAFNIFDTEQVPDLIRKGYEEGKRILKELV